MSYSKSAVFVIDSYANGVSVDRVSTSQLKETSFALQLEEESCDNRLKSRYVFNQQTPLQSLSRQLEGLAQRGVLQQSSIVFGQATDPFFPFDNKFSASMKLLEQFKRYVPNQLIVQTRSPLVVIAMPVIRELGKRIQITVPIETPHQNVLDKYLPGLPSIDDRLRLIKTLQKFGVHVRVQVGPILPYGDWKHDAQDFAKQICELASSIVLANVIDVGGNSRRQPVARALATQLAMDRKFHWLRPDTAKPLEEAICAIAPEKIEFGLPVGEYQEAQIPLFGSSQKEAGR